MDSRSLWRGAAPLLLASTSAPRRRLLASAGLDVETQAPGIDERAVEIGHAGTREIARRLACEKALAVSRLRPDQLVIGADQTLACDGRLYHKPVDRTEARGHLMALSGRTHVLSSAFALAENGSIVHQGLDEARMTMRQLGAEAVDVYLDRAGEAALASVGAYQVEGIGINLFDRIEGDHSTVLGLPLIPLLAALRARGLLGF
jgi:septum formation protein